MALGDLIIKMSADVATLQSDLGRASHMADRFANNVNRVLGGLGIGISAVAFAAFVKSTVELRSKLDNLSDTTGDNVLTLDALRRQGDISGVSMDTFGASLAKLSKSLNAAGDEGKGAGEALIALGLDIEKIKALKPGEAFIEISKALGKFEDSGAKVAIVTTLMSKGAAELLPFMKDIAEAGELQGRISREQTQEAERLEKQWRALSQSFSDSGKLMVDKAIPALNEMMRAIIQAQKESGLLTAAWVALGAAGAALSGKLDSDRIKELNAAIATGRKQLETGRLNTEESLFSFLIPNVRLSEQDKGKIRASVESLQAELDLMLGKLIVKKPELKFNVEPEIGKAFIIQLQEQLAKTGKLTVTEQTLKLLQTERYKIITPLQREHIIALATQIDKVKELEKLELSRLMIGKQLQESMDEEAKEMAEAAAASDKFNATMRERAYYENIFGEEVGGTTEELKLRLKVLLETIDAEEDRAIVVGQLKAGFDGLGNSLHTVDKDAQALGFTFQSAFEDAVLNGEKLSNVLKALDKDIARIILRRAITEPLGKAITGVIDDAIKGGLGGLFGGGETGTGEDFGLTGFAEGTNYVPETGLALVHRGEAIIPASENATAAHGAVNYYTEINATDAQSFAAMMASPQGRRVILRSVERAHNRAGRSSGMAI